MKKQELLDYLAEAEVELTDDAVDKLFNDINKGINDTVKPKDAKVKELEVTLAEVTDKFTKLSQLETVDKTEYDALVAELESNRAEYQQLEISSLLTESGFAKEDMDMVKVLFDNAMANGSNQEDVIASLQGRFITNATVEDTANVDPTNGATVPTIEGVGNTEDDDYAQSILDYMDNM